MQEEIRRILTEINKYDIELFEYAQSLWAYRLKFISPLVLNIKKQLGLDSHMNTVSNTDIYNTNKNQCMLLDTTIKPKFRKEYIGIFQPPGHKGPF